MQPDSISGAALVTAEVVATEEFVQLGLEQWETIVDVCRKVSAVISDTLSSPLYPAFKSPVNFACFWPGLFYDILCGKVSELEYVECQTWFKPIFNDPLFWEIPRH